MSVRSWVCALMLLSLGSAAAQDAEIRQFDIPTLEKLGRDIFEQDQAAWHATDALMALHPPAELRAESIRGWIVLSTPDGPLVRYTRLGANGMEAAYDIRIVGGQWDVSIPEDRGLTDEQKVIVAARDLAVSTVRERCGDNYNFVILRDPQSDGWLVWILASTTNPNLIMVGGHRRLTISADGTKILRTDALSRTCFVMEKPANIPERNLEAMVSTQLVSNIPVETFIFLSLQHQIPFVVLTPDKIIWGVEKGSMRPVSKLDK